jgi:putative ABC transport system substrate-binding protein
MKKHKSHITYYIYWLVFIVHFSLFILHLPSTAHSQQEPPTIAIIQPYDIKAYQEAVEGFLSHLGRHLKQDFNTIIYESPQGLYTTLQQEKNGSIQSTDGPHVKSGAHLNAGIDLILTVGTEATSEISRTISDIPIVFTMVLDPDNIFTYRNDIVGASVNIPPETQLKMIKEVLPTAKNVGVIYDPNRNADFVKNSTVLAKKLGLQIKSFPVKSQKDIPKALQRVSKDADVLWGIVDDTVYNSQTAKFVIQDTVRRYRIPFIGISASYVKAGALYALVFDNRDIGRQSAELANRILAATPVAELQSTTPERIRLALNLRTAELIGIEIPEKIIKKATIVYE